MSSLKSTHKKVHRKWRCDLVEGLTDILIYLFLNINKKFKLTIVLNCFEMKMKRFRLIKVNIKLILINRGDEEG